MKFVKGMVVGGMVSAGILMALVDTKNSRNMMLKKGRKAIRKFKMM